MATQKMVKKSLKNGVPKLETLADFVNFAVRQFSHNKIYFGHGTDNAWDEAVYLILHALCLPVDIEQVVLKKKLTACEKKAVLKIIASRIKKRVPAPYLTAEAWFAGLPFYIDKRALIPRSPLAELIAKHFLPWVNPRKILRILDIGTGSGCIAISCSYAFPRAKIDAIDVSAAALKIAAINCSRHKVTKKVRLLKSDLFAKLKGQTYDIIISNPPYVGKEEMRLLPPEYYHEPKLALLAGCGGDEIIKRIIKDAANYLSPQGILVVEVGNSAPLIMQKYPQVPFVWLEFAHGEGEVFLLTREQLLDISC